MAQLVPSSAAFNSPASTMQQQHQQQSLLQSSSSLSGDGLMLLDIACSPPGSVASFPYGLQANEGQTVPSSPTFSTWNYSPPSYWSDCSPSSTSAATNIKSEPIACSNSNSNSSGNFQLASLGCDSSLEELLDDYTFDYYYDSAQTVVVKEENIQAKPCEPKVEVHEEQKEQQPQQQGNALLRQCLRPAVDDYQQRCHLQFLNQIGTAAIAANNQQQPTQLVVPNSMKAAEMPSWMKNSANASLSGNGGAAQQGLASVLNLVMEQINEEVRSTCEILAISPSKFIVQIFLSCVIHHFAMNV